MTAIRRHHSSPLIELLSSWRQRSDLQGDADIAGRLGDWIGAMDAMHLDAALKSLAPAAPRAGTGFAGAASGNDVLPGHRALAARCAARVDAVQQELLGAAAQIGSARQGVASDAALSETAAWGRAYAARQAHLESRVRAVRTELQRALAKVSAWGRELATLDAAVADALGGRQQRLWMAVPRWLEWRIDQQPARADDDAQSLWRAEVLERLQPAWALVDAARSRGGVPA